MTATLTLSVPTHATHVVCSPEGEPVAWATSEGIALALLERQSTGAYVIAYDPKPVPTPLSPAEEAEVWAELATLTAPEPVRRRCEHGFARMSDGQCSRCDWERYVAEEEAERAAEAAFLRSEGVAEQVLGGTSAPVPPRWDFRTHEQRIDDTVREHVARVTHHVPEEAPAKLTIGFTAGGHLAKRSRAALRRAGVAIPARESERSIRKAVREAGFTPEIVPAREL